MMRWFDALPIHRKLIVLALAVSTPALLATIVGLVAFDAARFRNAATDDARALAQVIAENAAASIVFNDADAARQILASVQVRPVVSRACVYRADGTLLAGYERSSAFTCPSTPADERGWRAVASRVPVSRNGRAVGAVYVERLLSDLPSRIIVTGSAGLFMLLLGGALALGLARRMQAVVSRPIVMLANASRAIGRDERFDLAAIPSPADETGELVQAFSEMIERLLAAHTERERLLTREREASRLKDEFLAAVSHELRTPLNAILGWTQILASTKPNEQTIAKAISSLSRNAQAQNRVIEDLLDVSRIITGKLQLTLTAVDLRTALESAVEVIAPIARAKKLHVDVDMPAVACIVQGDFDRIRQVLWNVLANAVKFTPVGGAIDARISDEDGRFTIVVSDTGIGIPAEFVPHVFERFRQADGSTTREHGGLGLGLAIVKELTELHGGSVSAASRGTGHGATFSVSLPRLVGSAAEQRTIDPEFFSASRVRLDGVDVLAIDDNPDALDIVTAALTDAGARVRTASSGLSALEQIQQAVPQVILCDLAMPHMDGFEVLKRIRQVNGVSRTTPVLAVTAYASADYRERCRQAGFQGHLAKPYNTAELIREVAAALTRT